MELFLLGVKFSMGVMKVIKIKVTDFVGDDGKKIAGQYIYVVPVDGSAGPRRVFLSDARILDVDFFPKVGDRVYLVESAMGRVVDILEA